MGNERKYEPRVQRSTRRAIDFMRKLSEIEIFTENIHVPLAETEVETGKVSAEVNEVVSMAKANPLLTLLKRGGDA